MNVIGVQNSVILPHFFYDVNDARFQVPELEARCPK